MDSGSSATFGLMGLWIIFQLAFVLVILFGGLYALYCLNRAATGLDRMASVAEAWLAHQMYLERQRAEAESQPPATGPISTPDQQTPPHTGVTPVEWSRTPPSAP